MVAGATGADEAGLAEDGQVLGDRAERDIEPRRDLACRQLAVPGQAEDLAPMRLGHDLQGIHRHLV